MKLEVLPKESRLKSVYLAYMIYLLLGSFGVHHFYLKQYKRGVVYIVLFFLPILVSAFISSKNAIESLFYVFWGIMLIFLLIDLFTLVFQVNNYNREHFSTEQRKSIEID